MSCPKCGYCKECGRSNEDNRWWIYPYNPYPWWQSPYITWTGAPTTTTTTTSGNTTTIAWPDLYKENS